MSKPRILMYDVEWRPATAYVWKMYDNNISPDQLADPGGLLCFSAQWFGEKETMFFSEWEHGRRGMVLALHKLMTEADAVVTYNGDSYDNKKALGEFILQKLPPPPPITSIDLIKTVRRFGFISNKLAVVGPYLNIGEKVKNGGFRLWVDVMNGDERAQNKMKKYCIQDTKLLSTLYKSILPYIKNHPHLGKTSGLSCGACGGKKLQSRGYYRTKMYKTQRIQCQSCGSWSSGKRTAHG